MTMEIMMEMDEDRPTELERERIAALVAGMTRERIESLLEEIFEEVTHE
jgi:hypothetical protein